MSEIESGQGTSSFDRLLARAHADTLENTQEWLRESNDGGPTLVAYPDGSTLWYSSMSAKEAQRGAQEFAEMMEDPEKLARARRILDLIEEWSRGRAT